MWYLVAFLACLSVVHVHAQCLCPEKRIDVSTLGFTVIANVENDQGSTEEGYRSYGIIAQRVFLPMGHTNFSTTVYTNGKAGIFSVELSTGKRYLLEGIFEDGDYRKPLVSGCELLEKCKE